MTLGKIIVSLECVECVEYVLNTHTARQGKARQGRHKKEKAKAKAKPKKNKKSYKQ